MRQYYHGRPIAWGPLVLVAVLMTAVIWLDAAIQPYAAAAIACEAKNYAVQAVEDAVQQEISRKQVDLNQLVTVTRSADGTVQSVSSNELQQSALQADLTRSIQKNLSTHSHASISIPVGTLSGSSLLHGFGPSVPIRITLTNNVQTRLQSLFDSAGINQTRHRLVLHVAVTLYTYLAGKDADQQVSVEVPVAETVIVGTVPGVLLQTAQTSKNNG